MLVKMLLLAAAAATVTTAAPAVASKTAPAKKAVHAAALPVSVPENGGATQSDLSERFDKDYFDKNYLEQDYMFI